MLKMLNQDSRFKKAMENINFRLIYNGFIIQTYNYIQKNDCNELQTLEKDFINVYENMENYSKGN